VIQRGLLGSMFGVVLVKTFCSSVVCAALTFPNAFARLLCSVPDACVIAYIYDL
jgi:hypothetical protein